MHETTLDIADDLCYRPQGAAKRERKTIGEMISELARRSLTTRKSAVGEGTKAVYGLKARSRDVAVSSPMIDRQALSERLAGDRGPLKRIGFRESPAFKKMAS